MLDHERNDLGLYLLCQHHWLGREGWRCSHGFSGGTTGSQDSCCQQKEGISFHLAHIYIILGISESEIQEDAEEAADGSEEGARHHLQEGVLAQEHTTATDET